MRLERAFTEGVDPPEQSRHRAGFVTVRGTDLRLRGRPYRFVGANYWQAMNLASRGPGGDRARLLRELDDFKARGITNLRILAASEGPNTEPLRIVPALLQAPGVYDQDLLDGLDFVLHAMRERDMKAVMVMGNMWHWSGGFGQYLVWAGVADAIPYPPPRPGGDWDEYQRFSAGLYGNQEAVAIYLDHIQAIVTRKNRYTGTRYRDEPAIMAWELANEPRAMDNIEEYLDWIAATSWFIKQLDTRHLVTIGSEGDTSAPDYSGTDYLRDHDIETIDYGTAHVWVQNWGWYDPQRPAETYDFARAQAFAYADSHIERTRELDKPIVFEEFGLARDLNSFDPTSPLTYRDRYFTELFDHLIDQARRGPVAGANVWALAGEGRPRPPFGDFWSAGDPFIGDPPHEQQGWYSIYDTDRSTLAIITGAAEQMTHLCRERTLDPVR